jgi:hypothetical protein
MLEWKSDLSVLEAASSIELLALLDQVRPKREEENRRRWTVHPTGVFSVRSSYSALFSICSDPLSGPLSVQVFKDFWLNNVPSKVSIFGRLLLEKLPTREALYNKDIITNMLERYCVSCFKKVQDIHHIFFTCTVSSQIWYNVFR